MLGRDMETQTAREQSHLAVAFPSRQATSVGEGGSEQVVLAFLVALEYVATPALQLNTHYKNSYPSNTSFDSLCQQIIITFILVCC